MKYDNLKDAMEELKRENPDLELSRQINYQLSQLRRAYGLLYRKELPVYRQPEFAAGYIKPILEFLEFLDEL